MSLKIGMLWFDNDPRTTTDQKVARAADYYRTKYGKQPDLCYVNPASVPASTVDLMVGEIAVQSNKSIMRNHFWIGCAEIKSKSLPS